MLSGEVVRDTIVRGVGEGILAYVGKAASGDYNPFVYGKPLSASDLELSDDMYIITKEMAEAYLKSKEKPVVVPGPGVPPAGPGPGPAPPVTPGGTAGPTVPPAGPGPVGPPPVASSDTAAKLTWTGTVPAQKWMNFYTKVLSKFASGKGLTLTVAVEVSPEGGVSRQKIEESKVALRELGMNDDVGEG